MQSLDAKTALVVVDEPVLRQLLVDFIGSSAPTMELLMAGDGPSAWDVFRRRRPLHLVLDLSIPGYSGFTFLRLVTLNRFAPRVLIFSALPPHDFEVPAGFTEAVVVQKFAPVASLERALLLLFSGRSLPRLRQGESVRAGISGHPTPLTRSELLVLALLMEGFTPQSAAVELGISPHTVLTHRKNMMRKLGVKSALMLARRAFELGLGTPMPIPPRPA